MHFTAEKSTVHVAAIRHDSVYFHFSVLVRLRPCRSFKLHSHLRGRVGSAGESGQLLCNKQLTSHCPQVISRAMSGSALFMLCACSILRACASVSRQPVAHAAVCCCARHMFSPGCADRCADRSPLELFHGRSTCSHTHPFHARRCGRTKVCEGLDD